MRNYKISLVLTTILAIHSCLNADIVITWDKEKEVDKNTYEKATLEYLKNHSPNYYKEYKSNIEAKKKRIEKEIKEQTLIHKDLMWEDNNAVKLKPMNFTDAREFCKSLRIAGFDDWRLPMYTELERDKIILSKAKKKYKWFYWSSTKYLYTKKTRYFGINFKNISKNISKKSNSYATTAQYTRCVRDYK